MNSRKFIISTGAFLLVFMLLTGYVAVAAEYGSKDDPIVTLSYVTDVLAPNTLKQMDSVIAEKVKEYDSKIDSKISSYSNTLNTKLEQFDTKLIQVTSSSDFINKIADAVAKKTGNTSSSAQWKVVKLSQGKVLKADVGAEIVLRIGNAVCYANATPGLVNLSDGSTINNGTAIIQNKLYLVTVKDNGIKATNAVTAIVCGNYSIS